MHFRIEIGLFLQQRIVGDAIDALCVPVIKIEAIFGYIDSDNVGVFPHFPLKGITINRGNAMDTTSNRTARRFVALLIAALLVAASTRALGGGPGYDIGDEYWVDGPGSIQPGSDRGFPDVAVGPNGAAVHVWQAFTNDRFDIFFRRFDLSDEPIGDPAPPPQLVNTLTFDDQSDPRVAIRADGDFFVVWTSDEPDPTQGGSIRNWVRGQLFAADGTPLGSEQLISEIASGTSGDINATVAALNNGSFVVTWASINGFGSDSQPCSPGAPPGCLTFSVQARQVNSAGSAVGGQFQINDEVDSTQSHPSVVATADGGFVVFWESFSGNDGDPSSGSIQARRFAADGTPLGGDFQVNTTTPGSQDSPEAAIDDEGRILVVYESFDSDSNSVRARLFDLELNPMGDDFLVPSFTADANQNVPRVAGGFGYFLVAWSVFGGVGTDTDFAVNGRVVRGSDQFDGVQFQVNVFENGSQTFQAIGARGADAVMSWRSDPSAFAPADDSIIARSFDFDQLFADGFEE
jgi:hypothetical protein